MKVFVLGLDGATWDLLGPLAEQGALPNLERLRRQGVSGTLQSVFPPLSPVAWTGMMTGKNSGKHGVFEFLDFGHDPRHGKVNSSRSIRSELIWEIAGRHGRKTVAGAVPMSYPARPTAGLQFFLGDFLSPPNAPDFSTDEALFRELEQHLGQPYPPWNTSVHDGRQEAKALASLTEFLDLHLRSILFLMQRCDWDLFVYDVMAIDRIQHELWHVWDLSHRAARGREKELEALRPGFIDFWKRMDDGIGQIEAALPADTNLILISDHGFGPVEWFVNFNVWLLDRGYIALDPSFYVQQKAWFYRRGVTPEWIYNCMARLGMANHRVSRFRGEQDGSLANLADNLFLSRKHIDWSRTKAYSQGNFGQINLNLRGRQPEGSVSPEDAPSVLRDLKAELMAMTHPETGEPLIDRILEREELYQGPFAERGPDLTVVPRDWRFRTIGLHDFTTNRAISPAFGPTGDHRMEGIFVATGPGIERGKSLGEASLLDICPTALRLLGVPVPSDLDGRSLDEILVPQGSAPEFEAVEASNGSGASYTTEYSAEEEEAIQKRLGDLGYL